jgi:hypothetical protein
MDLNLLVHFLAVVQKIGMKFAPSLIVVEIGSTGSSPEGKCVLHTPVVLILVI